MVVKRGGRSIRDRDRVWRVPGMRQTSVDVPRRRRWGHRRGAPRTSPPLTLLPAAARGPSSPSLTQAALPRPDQSSTPSGCDALAATELAPTGAGELRRNREGSPASRLNSAPGYGWRCRPEPLRPDRSTATSRGVQQDHRRVPPRTDSDQHVGRGAFFFFFFGGLRRDRRTR